MLKSNEAERIALHAAQIIKRLETRGGITDGESDLLESHIMKNIIPQSVEAISNVLRATVNKVMESGLLTVKEMEILRKASSVFKIVRGPPLMPMLHLSAIKIEPWSSLAIVEPNPKSPLTSNKDSSSSKTFSVPKVLQESTALRDFKEEFRSATAYVGFSNVGSTVLKHIDRLEHMADVHEAARAVALEFANRDSVSNSIKAQHAVAAIYDTLYRARMRIKRQTRV